MTDDPHWEVRAGGVPGTPSAPDAASSLMRRVIVVAGLSVVLYLGAVVLGDGAAVAESFRRIGWGTVVAAGLLPLGGFWVRYLRWADFVHSFGYRLPPREHILAYLSGFAFTATPGKVGENLRLSYLRNHGVAATDGLAAFGVERLGDLVVISAMTLPAAALLPARGALLATVGVGGTILGVSLLVSGVITVPRGLRRIDRLGAPLRRMDDLLKAVRSLLTVRLALRSAGWGVLAWLAEGLTFALIVRALDIPLPLPSAVGVFAFATLAGALSFLPGGIGATEAILAGVILAEGGTRPDAVSAVLVTRALTLWLAIGLGLLCLAALRRLPHPVKSDQAWKDKGK